jgi:2'-5' RNA ligase
LTLRFFGELPEETLPKLVERLGGTCKGTGALDVEAVFAGAPWRGARVIALEVVEPTKRLAKLQARIETDAQAAGQPAENRAFRPHLTLARLEHPDFQPAAAHASVAGWSVAELALVKSVLGPGGAMHSVVAHFPLQ